MSDQNIIEHPGIVEEIREKDITVRILSVSACAGCHAKGACSMAEMEEKIVEVSVDEPSSFRPGERVEVSLNLASGNQAVLLGYFLPLLVLVLALVVSLSLGASEGLSGLIAILVLVPYYLTLWLLRDKIRKRTRFFVRKEMKIEADMT